MLHNILTYSDLDGTDQYKGTCDMCSDWLLGPVELTTVSLVQKSCEVDFGQNGLTIPYGHKLFLYFSMANLLSMA